MTRAIVGVLDSLGVGAALDADRFGDVGANTLGHIALACAAGEADRDGVRSGALNIPNLAALGLVRAAAAACGQALPVSCGAGEPAGCYGYAAERSRGKDTPSGHWELMGLPVEHDWGYFPAAYPSIPAQVVDALIERGQLPGILGNAHASGTQILEALGREHLRTGKPIIYTSADSVLQIAAHEEHFGLERLYELCRIARELVDPLHIGRVIARPFITGEEGAFRRTGNRKDFAMPPHGPTLLNHLVERGRQVIAIGKVGDIFAGSGISCVVKADGNEAIMDRTVAAVHSAPEGALVFANFVDFDTLYGHRRDVVGYAAALEAFDRRLPQLQRAMRAGDVLVLSADHGCDPTWRGTDHTREYVPVLLWGPGIAPRALGRRSTFADVGQTLAIHLGIAPLACGISLL